MDAKRACLGFGIDFCSINLNKDTHDLRLRLLGCCWGCASEYHDEEELGRFVSE